MAQSMTGFAQVDETWGLLRIGWRLKSVNQRFFDCAIRLPDGLSELEIPAKKLLKTRFARGYLDCALTIHQEAEASGPLLDIDESLVQALVKAEKRLAKQAPGAGHKKRGGGLGLGALMSWPGVIREKRFTIPREPLNDPLGRRILEILEAAAQKLHQFRSREGAAIIGVVSGQLHELSALTEQVAARLPDLRGELEGRLRRRLEELSALPVDEARMAQEVVMLLNRLDVAEELDRLRMHLREMGKILDSDEPLGRRLDFLCQELNREANTICSKSQDGSISRLGVEIKVVVEKLREQVQNLE